VNYSRFAKTALDRRRIRERCRRIAMVGFRRIRCRQACDVTPVSLHESEVLGRRSYPTLIEVPDPIEVVDILETAAVRRKSSGKRLSFRRKWCGCSLA
jgi:predicted CoA-binding protein